MSIKILYTPMPHFTWMWMAWGPYPGVILGNIGSNTSRNAGSISHTKRNLSHPITQNGCRCSVINSGQILCNSTNCSSSGFSVLCCLAEFALTHIHWISDVVCPILHCPLLLLPSIFLSIRSFLWVGSSHQVAKELEFQLHHQSFHWSFRVALL